MLPLKRVIKMANTVCYDDFCNPEEKPDNAALVVAGVMAAILLLTVLVYNAPPLSEEMLNSLPYIP
jgi:hypothetical protein